MFMLASAMSWGMFGVGVALMTLVLLRRSWRYEHRNRSSLSSAAASRRAASREMSVREAPAEFVRWQVDMHEVARDLKAELDSKMGALQALIRLAREESRRLEAAIQDAKRLGVSPCRDTLEAIQQLGESAANAERHTLPPVSENNVVDLIKPSDQRSRVYALSDAGQSPAAIAERMEVTVGEVELMLSVRRPKRG